MTALLKVLLGTATVAFAAPLAAQIPSSSAEYRSNPHANQRTLGAIELKRSTACVVDRRTGYGQSLIATRPGSKDERRIAQPIMRVMDNCISEYSSSMMISYAQLRGAIAEEFYLRAFPADPDFAVVAHPRVAISPDWVKGKLSEQDRIFVFQHEFANCVVAAAPADAAAMLRTEPRSVAERKVVARLNPSLAPCLMAGKTFELDAASLRALLAEALYRSVRQWTGLSAVLPVKP